MKRIKLLWSRFLQLFSKKKAVVKQPVISLKRIMPGIKVWECDITTGDIVEAEVKETRYVLSTGRIRKNYQVLIRQNCMYEYTMNGENATRKFETRIKDFFKTQQN